MEAPGKATLVGRPRTSDQEPSTTDGHLRAELVSLGRLGASKNLAALPLRSGPRIAGHHAWVSRPVSTPVHPDQNLAGPCHDGTSKARSVEHDGGDRNRDPDLVDVHFDEIRGGELMGEKSCRDGKSMHQSHF